MDLASVVAALASVGVRVSGSTPNNNIQEDSSRACPTGLAGPEPSGTHNDPGQHFHRLAVLSRWAFSFEPAKRKDVNGRAAAGVLSRHGTSTVPSSVGLLLPRRCGMLSIYASFVCSSLLFLTVLCLLRRLFSCVLWRRFISYLLSSWLHRPLWPPPLFVVRSARAP